MHLRVGIKTGDSIHSPKLDMGILIRISLYLEIKYLSWNEFRFDLFSILCPCIVRYIGEIALTICINIYEHKTLT